MVQPWLGAVADLGPTTFAEEEEEVECYPPAYFAEWPIKRKRAHRNRCGAAPRGGRVSVRPRRPPGTRCQRLWNDPAGLCEGVATRLERHAPHWRGGAGLLNVSAPAGRLSTSAHLLRVTMGDGCEALLGIGHLHRRDGVLNIARELHATEDGSVCRGNAREKLECRIVSRAERRRRIRAANREPFKWGSRYTQFFYTLAPTPPHAVIATSGEFCLASEQDARDCESVQFVAGLAHEAAEAAAGNTGRLLLSFGVNDCEARTGAIELGRVWRMLVPLAPRVRATRGTACEASKK
jgi:hypothetical protein